MLLWDDQDYPGCEASCCTSMMPWFVKTLIEIVNDVIELSTHGFNDHQTHVNGTPLDLVKAYILLVTVYTESSFTIWHIVTVHISINNIWV